MHVVLRAAAVLGGLRKRHIYHALRDATITVALRELAYDARGAFRIVHLSVQQTHIHLLVEADDKYALSRGMQSFQISAAKNINRAFSRQRKLTRRRRGSVFPIGFIKRSSRTRRRRVVLSLTCSTTGVSTARTRASRGVEWNVSPFSTGVLFKGWKEREGAEALWRWRDTYDPMVVPRAEDLVTERRLAQGGHDLVPRCAEHAAGARASARRCLSRLSRLKPCAVRGVRVRAAGGTRG